MINRIRVWSVVMVILILVPACGTLDVEVENLGKETVVTSTPAAENLPTSSPMPEATDMVETSTPPAPPVHPAAGVVYNTAEGLWNIDAQDSPVLLLDKPEARLSPDGTQAVYVEAGEGADDVWLVDVASGERRNLTNTADRFEEYPRWWPGTPGW